MSPSCKFAITKQPAAPTKKAILKSTKDNLFRKAADVLNDFLKNNKKNPNLEVLEQLKSIYMGLNDMDNYKKIKNILDKK